MSTGLQKLAAVKEELATQRIEKLYARADSLGGHFRHAIDVLETETAKALDVGFAGVRSHIFNTGGTADLRDMIANAEARSKAREAAMQPVLVKQLKGETGTLQGMLDRLKGG